MNTLLKERIFTGITAEDIVKKNITALYDTSKLDEALKIFEITDYTYLPVVSSSDGKLIGVLKQDETFSYYRKQMSLLTTDDVELSKTG